MSNHETPVPQGARTIQTGKLREAIPGMEVCDFCGSASVAWAFPAHGVVIPLLDFASNDAWAACEPCHDLIVANDRSALTERCIEGFAANARVEGVSVTLGELAALRSHFLLIHRAFFAARNGEPTRE